MANRRALTVVRGDAPICLGHFTLTATGMDVRGRPSFEEYEQVGEFVKRAHKRSGWWLAAWVAYPDTRSDWEERISQAHDVTGLSEKTLKNLRAIGRGIEPSRRRDDVEFAIHAEVVGLTPDEQSYWLAKVAEEGWDRRDLRLNIRASRRRKVLEGQAILEGQFRVLLCDPPWLYGDRPPSGSGAQQHYGGMTIEALCKLPVAAHSQPNAVLFMWVTAPFLYANPGPREVLEAWGFTPKTGMVWHKRRHNFGHYVSMRHEHVIIATRGSCLPDRPTPMPDSVFTSEQEAFEHSQKPEELRQIIERLYDGPYLELFARDRHEGWAAFGNDAALWGRQAAEQEVTA